MHCPMLTLSPDILTPAAGIRTTQTSCPSVRRFGGIKCGVNGALVDQTRDQWTLPRSEWRAPAMADCRAAVCLQCELPPVPPSQGRKARCSDSACGHGGERLSCRPSPCRPALNTSFNKQEPITPIARVGRRFDGLDTFRPVDVDGCRDDVGLVGPHARRQGHERVGLTYLEVVAACSASTAGAKGRKGSRYLIRALISSRISRCSGSMTS